MSQSLLLQGKDCDGETNGSSKSVSKEQEFAARAKTAKKKQKPVKDHQKYSRLLRKYKEGYVSVSVYLNVTTMGRRYYDTVIHRKIKNSGSGDLDWRRGANLKPRDLPILIRLLKEAEEFLRTEKLFERDSI